MTLTLRHSTLAAALLAICALTACGSDSGSSLADASTGDGDASSTGDGGSEPGWTTLAPIPEAVQETAVVEVSGSIYVIGGIDGAGATLSRVSVYEVASNTWSSAASLPIAVHHANAAVVGGKIYVVGSLFANFSANPAVWEYDPAANEWATLGAMPTGSERGASALGVIDGAIYIAGGLRSLASVSDFSSYTPSTMTWNTSLGAMPQALNHLAGQSVGGKLYVLGGRNSGIDGVVGEVQIYDPQLMSWNAGATMLTPRGGMASGLVDGLIVLVGGEGNTDATSGVFPEAELYNPADDSWSRLPDMPIPRHGMGAVGFEGVLYVPGGATVQGYGATGVHESLRL